MTDSAQARRWLGAAVVLAGMHLAACDESDQTKVETGPAPYTTATAIEPAPLTTDFGVLEVVVPQNALSIGIVVQGSSRDVITFIEHRGTLLGRLVGSSLGRRCR